MGNILAFYAIKFLELYLLITFYGILQMETKQFFEGDYKSSNICMVLQMKDHLMGDH